MESSGVNMAAHNKGALIPTESGKHRSYSKSIRCEAWYGKAIKTLRRGCLCKHEDCFEVAREFIGAGEYFCTEHFYAELRARLG